MANYFTIDYEDTTPTTSGIVELNYGFEYSSGLTVNVAMFAGSGFTPTHYKMWGIELVEGEGVVSSGSATWQAFPADGTTTAYLDGSSTASQSASVMFKDSGETETEVYQTNGVVFDFTESDTHPSASWSSEFSEVGYDSITSIDLENLDLKTSVTLSKDNIAQLKFDDRDFTGLRIDSESVYVDPDSQIGRLVNMEDGSFVTIEKGYDNQGGRRMVTVDDGTGPRTITTYDQNLRSDLEGEDIGRISNVVWEDELRLTQFRAYKFSTYGFTTINSVEFTDDSPEGGYNGETITFRVVVKDTLGDLVEEAPVTITTGGDTIGTIQESMPVDTNSSGIAEFTLPITAEGNASFGAGVIDTFWAPHSVYSTTDLTVYSFDKPATQRSLLTQLEQIFRSETYSDTVSGVNTVDVAEPSTSTAFALSDSVLEHDMNVFRTLIKQVKFGTASGTNWYDDLGTYFDPTDTDAGDTDNKEFSMSAIKNNTLDANTIILAVDESNSGAGYSINAGDDGFLFTVSTRYATPDNRVGLPIYQSTTNSGSYHDEGALDRVVAIDLIDMSNGAEFKSDAGDIVYAKFHDGADNSGTGDGTDVYVKFYTDAGEYTTTSGDPSTIMMVYPYRKTLDQMEEYEWVRTTFVSSWEGDAEIVEDISNLWSYTGASDGESDPAWTSISGSPIVTSAQTDIASAIDELNDEFGDRSWTNLDGALTAGQSITASLDALDMGIYDLSQSVSASVAELYVEVTASGTSKNTPYTLPYGITYTPDATVGQEGSNLDVFMDGQLLSASTGVNGLERDKDYAEVNSTQIMFHFDIYEGSNITYKVRQ